MKTEISMQFKHVSDYIIIDAGDWQFNIGIQMGFRSTIAIIYKQFGI